MGNSVASLLRRRRLKALIAALKDDVHAIGPLAQLCHRQEHPSIVNPAVETLLSLLPRVEVGDSRSLSDRQMQALLGLLDVSESEQAKLDPARLRKSLFYRFVVFLLGTKWYDGNRMLLLPPVIFKALERAGDSRAIRPVKRLATSSLRSPFQQEAQECLAVLEKQATARDKERFLLQPSLEHAAQETLLRPTAPQTDSQPELLLRATNERAEP